MATTTTGTSDRFTKYINQKLDKTNKTQKEIAQAVGYKNQNMITMLKLGDVKLALDRVPAMAKALNVDAFELFKVALTQFYDPEAVRLLMSLIEHNITNNEQRVLDFLRSEAPDGVADPDNVAYVTPAERKLLDVARKAPKPISDLTPEQAQKLIELLS